MDALLPGGGIEEEDGGRPFAGLGPDGSGVEEALSGHAVLALERDRYTLNHVTEQYHADVAPERRVCGGDEHANIAADGFGGRPP
ncbi:MAG TPA: hypothetical protein VFS33_02605 [Gemmatimonadales bacterium]|nr:hypothetical protein [Gemmatimonadales bacterium]